MATPPCAVAWCACSDQATGGCQGVGSSVPRSRRRDQKKQKPATSHALLMHREVNLCAGFGDHARTYIDTQHTSEEDLKLLAIVLSRLPSVWQRSALKNCRGSFNAVVRG